MKYETIEENNFLRIRALKDFSDVKKGDLGGLIANKNSLSQEGDCWVDFTTLITNESVVKDNVRIKGHVLISGKSEITGNVKINGIVSIYDSIITDNALIESQKFISIMKSTISNEVKILNRFSNIKREPEIIIINSLLSEKSLIDGCNIIIKDSKIKDNSIVASNSYLEKSFILNNVLIENGVIENNLYEQKRIINSTIKDNIIVDSDISNSDCAFEGYIAYPIENRNEYQCVYNGNYAVDYLKEQDMIITYFNKHKTFFIHYKEINEKKTLYGKYTLKELKAKLKTEKNETQEIFRKIFHNIKLCNMSRYGFWKSLFLNMRF